MSGEGDRAAGEWTAEIHEIAEHDVSQGESMSLDHQRRALREIERLRADFEEADDKNDAANEEIDRLVAQIEAIRTAGGPEIAALHDRAHGQNCLGCRIGFALAEHERVGMEQAAEIENLRHVMTEETRLLNQANTDREQLEKRLAHAHDAANALYSAAAECVRRSDEAVDIDDLVSAIGRMGDAIDPAEQAAAREEAARRDGLEARLAETLEEARQSTNEIAELKHRFAALLAPVDVEAEVERRAESIVKGLQFGRVLGDILRPHVECEAQLRREVERLRAALDECRNERDMARELNEAHVLAAPAHPTAAAWERLRTLAISGWESARAWAQAHGGPETIERATAALLEIENLTPAEQADIIAGAPGQIGPLMPASEWQRPPGQIGPPVQQAPGGASRLTPTEEQAASDAWDELPVSEAEDVVRLLPDGVVALGLSAKLELLGKLVREVCIKWAAEQPSPKASWLAPWWALSEPDKEVDRRIGERLFAEGHRAVDASRPPTFAFGRFIKGHVQQLRDGSWEWSPDGGFDQGVIPLAPDVCDFLSSVAKKEPSRPVLSEERETLTRVVDALTVNQGTIVGHLANLRALGVEAAALLRAAREHGGQAASEPSGGLRVSPAAESPEDATIGEDRPCFTKNPSKPAAILHAINERTPTCHFCRAPFPEHGQHVVTLEGVPGVMALCPSCWKALEAYAGRRWVPAPVVGPAIPPSARTLTQDECLRAAEQAGHRFDAETGRWSWTPKPGDRVWTVDPLTSVICGEWARHRRPGVEGVIVYGYRDTVPVQSTRSRWKVRHDDGTEAPYDQDELRPEPAPFDPARLRSAAEIAFDPPALEIQPIRPVTTGDTPREPEKMD